MNDYNILSDSSLLFHLKDGHHSAYTEIYNRYFPLLYTFAYKKLSDEDLAKDMVQEVFIQLWQKKGTLLESGNLASFLYTMLRNRVLDYYAHQKVENKFTDFLVRYAPTVLENADHPLREKDLQQYIDKQISKLPNKMRRVFELSRNDHFSNLEIAKILDTSESNVSHQITNAVKILRAKLAVLTKVIF